MAGSGVLLANLPRGTYTVLTTHGRPDFIGM
ncbi:hypothetical protein EV283_1007 [Sphingomonas sp. BK036]|nr:hypothetical protein EV283_1007 [Sphingomonas sp. BK036]